MVLYGKSSQEYPRNAERGNSMPKLQPAFGHCLQRFFFFKKLFYQKQCIYVMNMGVT